MTFHRRISKYDNIVFVREGWGNKKQGSFWKKGAYYWEAWIEGQKVATKRSIFMPSPDGYSETPNLVQTLTNVKFGNGFTKENLMQM